MLLSVNGSVNGAHLPECANSAAVEIVIVKLHFQIDTAQVERSRWRLTEADIRLGYGESPFACTLLHTIV